jgi:protein-S-isoprenylcysteine O-methyltransferase Ste14
MPCRHFLCWRYSTAFIAIAATQRFWALTSCMPAFCCCTELLTLGFSVFAMVMLHLQILQEERYLVHAFGAPYQAYCRQVFRYLGRK